MRRHLKLHQTENLLSCEYCEKKFTRNDALKQHRTKCMLVTKKNENFSCQVCNKNFKSVNILHVHQKTHGDKIYNCYICYKIYKNKAKLNEHLKTHMSENICIVCSKKFSSNDNLLKHQRVCHVTIWPMSIDLDIHPSYLTWCRPNVWWWKTGRLSSRVDTGYAVQH